MRNESVKTVSIYINKQRSAKWIFDVSDKTAEKILNDYESAGSILVIDNVPAKCGLMKICISKEIIDYVIIE